MLMLMGADDFYSQSLTSTDLGADDMNAATYCSLAHDSMSMYVSTAAPLNHSHEYGAGTHTTPIAPDQSAISPHINESPPKHSCTSAIHTHRHSWHTYRPHHQQHFITFNSSSSSSSSPVTPFIPVSPVIPVIPVIPVLSELSDSQKNRPLTLKDRLQRLPRFQSNKLKSIQCISQPVRNALSNHLPNTAVTASSVSGATTTAGGGGVSPRITSLPLTSPLTQIRSARNRCTPYCYKTHYSQQEATYDTF